MLDTTPYVIYQWRNILEKILTTSNFRSNSHVTIRVNKYNVAKNSPGICCTLLLATTLSKFQIFMRSFAQFATPLNELCLEPLWPSCRHSVNSNFLVGLPNGFQFWSSSVKTPSSSRIVSYWYFLFPIWLNLIQNIDFFWSFFFCCFWSVFRNKLSKIGI